MHHPTAALGLYVGAIENALAEVFRKLLLFLPLGWLAALVVMVASRAQPAARRSLLFVAWLPVTIWGLGIEMLQVVLPPHLPDWGDVLLAATGAALGVLGVEWVTRDLGLKQEHTETIRSSRRSSR